MLAAEFYDLCAAHDWYYNFADSHAVWLTGEHQRLNLVRAMEAQPELEPIFYAWQRYKLSGEPFGDERWPRPERPQVHTFEGDVPSVHPDQMELSI